MKELLAIYGCLCDLTRLRLLHVLEAGPLCVCHFQKILGEPQVKISKHLGYLKTRGLVESRREGQWVIYSLPAKPSRVLSANLACLQDCVSEEPVFRKDAERRRKLDQKLKTDGDSCCPLTPGSAKAKEGCCA